LVLSLPKTGKVIKKYVYIPVLILIALAGNLFCTYLIFRSPQVQTWMVQKATTYLSKELNTKVSIGGFRISWFMDVVMDDFLLEDRHNAAILKSSTIRVDFGKINIRKKFIRIRNISINSTEINLQKYLSDSTFNYSFLVDYFSGKPQTTKTVPWKVDLKGVTLNNCSLRFNNDHIEHKPGAIDYNHLFLSEITLEARNISLAGDSTTVDIQNLAAKELSGFTLQSLTGDIVSRKGEISMNDLKIKTPGSDLQADLKLQFTDLKSFSNFIDSVRIDAKFSPSHLDVNEIQYFTEGVSGMENLIHFEGVIKGKISSLKAREFQLDFGNNSTFIGEITMDGLPDIQETFIHLKVKKFSTDYYDLTNIRLPGNKKIPLPEEIKNLGVVDVKGFFTGFIYDFVSSADFTTSVGKLETDLSLQTGRGNLLKYKGQFNLVEWDLGKTFDISDKVGTINLVSSVNGEIHNKKHNNLEVDALIGKVILLNNEFNDISINGKLIDKLFNGDLTMKDELANLDFRGVIDLTDTIPRMNFTAILQDAYLSKLNLWEHDSTVRLSTRMDLNFKGSNIDNLLGYLNFDSTTLSEGDKSYQVMTIRLSIQNFSQRIKRLSLESDLVDASFNGQFTFGDFYHSLTNIISLYLPSLRLTPQDRKTVSKDQIFEYLVQVKDITPLTEMYLPEFHLLSGATLSGRYNSKNNDIVLNGLADGFTYNGVDFSNWYVKGTNTGSSMEIVTGVSSITLSEKKAAIGDKKKGAIENFVFKAFMQGDSINYEVNWDDNIAENHNIGDIDGYFSFIGNSQIHTRFKNFNVRINNQPWVAVQNNEIVIDSTSVQVDNLEIFSATQKLKLKGKISENPADALTLNFDNLDISNADALIKVKNIDFDGVLSGIVSIHDIYKTKRLEALVEVKDFAFNKERMGDASIKSIWNHEISALDIQLDVIYKGNIGTHLPISAKGLIYPGKREKGNFDLDIKVINYKLASLNPFLKGIASNIKGFASGNLKMQGTFDKPEITGELDLLRAQMKIDYLNVTYAFADKVIAEPTNIHADNIIVYDSLGNTASLDFSLKHKYFRDIRMNIDIEADKLNALYTTYKQNNIFYGNAFGSGKVNINGSFTDISIKIDAKSESGSQIYIPINLAVDATESRFIRFKNNELESTGVPGTYYTKDSGTDVDINLQVTNNAGIQLFLPENIGNIKGTGSGNIQIGVNKQGEMTMYGEYVMDEGSFLFTLGNIINRVFSIESGSTISFNGSPYESDINLRAIYRVRASMKGLSPEYAGKSIPVDCIISLKNNLYNPDISFSLYLPEATNDLNQLVFSAIDTTNQVIMTQQIVSLLVLKTFALSSAPALSTSVSSSSIEVLTDQLSNMLSQISDDVDIGVKYRTGDALTDDEVEVALSTNLFNDRVSVDGNVGMYTTGTTQNSSGLVGDVVVDVKITPDGRFRVKAFNKSNRFDITTSSSSEFKQGIGVYYRYEFDKFSEIFTRKRKKLNITP